MLYFLSRPLKHICTLNDQAVRKDSPQTTPLPRKVTPPQRMPCGDMSMRMASSEGLWLGMFYAVYFTCMWIN